MKGRFTDESLFAKARDLIGDKADLLIDRHEAGRVSDLDALSDIVGGANTRTADAWALPENPPAHWCWHGGGINGAARTASAAAGCDVLLVEKGDFGSGLDQSLEQLLLRPALSYSGRSIFDFVPSTRLHRRPHGQAGHGSAQ